MYIPQIFCVFWLVCNYAESFNLDVENIVELKDPSEQSGSYFGYSLAFYRDETLR